MDCTQRELGKETCALVTLRNCKFLDASEFVVRRVHAEEVLVPNHGDAFIFPCADGAVSWQERSRSPNPPLRSRSPPDQGQEHHNDLHGEADRSEEQRLADDLNLARLHHFGRKALLGLFVGCALYAGGWNSERIHFGRRR